jgi:cytochrome c
MFRSALIAAVLMTSATMAAETPNLGQLTSARDLASWDISVGPDGVGLPAGRGTARQGEPIYAEKCASCHGAKGEGQPNDRLAGGHGTLTGDGPAVKTVGSFWPHATTLFDYVRRAMPISEPQSLTANEVYAVSAYVLALNGIVETDQVMDARSLPQVKMPNRDKFFAVYPGAIE